MSGVANPNYKTGRYSKHLPVQVAPRAEAARRDPQLLSLADDIAVYQALLQDAMGRLETGESGAAWRALKVEYEALAAALASDDLAGVQQHFTALGQLVTRGVGQAAALREVGELEATHRRLIQVHVKTLQGLQQMITVQQNQLMVGALMQTILEAAEVHVADVAARRRLLMAVQTECTRLSTLEEH